MSFTSSMFKLLIFLLSYTTLTFTVVQSEQNQRFPEWFEFGTATSSYQTEGAWNEDGKRSNVWDTYTHDHREEIIDYSTGDVACDSYHRYEEDIDYAAYMGVNFYRFSISWARILPFGYSYKINKAGIRYYNNIIDDLISRNITPMITMYHWDLPQALQDIGGWPNPLMIDFFVEYARVLFEYFGDRVKTWITFNEPKYICALGYGSTHFAPGSVNQSGVADYLCGHTILKAHAKVYRIYKEEYYPDQQGKIAIILDTTWYEPATNTSEDMAAAFTTLEFSLGWFMNPIFADSGNYPRVMIERIGNRSRDQGFRRSRLPDFTQEEIEYIRGTSDFLGINVYTSALVTAKKVNYFEEEISYFNDIGVEAFQLTIWPNSSNPSNKVTPWAARKLLKFIKNYYGDFPIVITENGYGDIGEIKDYKRVLYYKEYLSAIYEAITEDKVDVRAYTAWSLLDSFEWIYGYTQKYGLIHVNFTDPSLTRTIKNSARYYKRLIETHDISWDYFGDE